MSIECKGLLKKWQKIFLLILGIVSISYYITIVIIDSYILGINFIWLILGIILFGILVLDKKGKLKKINLVGKLILLFIVLIGLTISIINIIFISNYKKYNYKDTPDYIILLGGGMKMTGEPSNSMITRIEGACDVWFALDVKCPIIVTGGKIFPAPYSESLMMNRELQERGIPKEYILEEPLAKDTIENLKNSAKLINHLSNEDFSTQKVLFVTSKTHIARTLYLAELIGYKNVIGIGIEIPVYNAINTYIREILSVMKLNLRIIINGGSV